MSYRIFKATFGLDNAAFGESREECSAEIVAVLKNLIRKIESNGGIEDASPRIILRDTNGNDIGEAQTVSLRRKPS